MERIYNIVNAKKQSRKKAIKADSISGEVVDLGSRQNQDGQQSFMAGKCQYCG